MYSLAALWASTKRQTDSYNDHLVQWSVSFGDLPELSSCHACQQGNSDGSPNANGMIDMVNAMIEAMTETTPGAPFTNMVQL